MCGPSWKEKCGNCSGWQKNKGRKGDEETCWKGKSLSTEGFQSSTVAACRTRLAPIRVGNTSMVSADCRSQILWGIADARAIFWAGLCCADIFPLAVHSEMTRGQVIPYSCAFADALVCLYLSTYP